MSRPVAKIRYVGGKRVFSIGRKRVSRKKYDAYLESVASSSSLTRSKWPIISIAAGVHPSQVAEAKALAASRGVPTEYLPSGEAVFTDRGHRKRYLKAHQMRDNSGGFGD